MAKGDRVQVLTVDGASHEAVADKDGRRVEHRFLTRAKQLWIEVSVVTRGGKPTGMTLSIPLAHVRAIVEQTTPRDLKPKPRRVPAQDVATD